MFNIIHSFQWYSNIFMNKLIGADRNLIRIFFFIRLFHVIQERVSKEPFIFVSKFIIVKLVMRFADSLIIRKEAVNEKASI